MKPHPINGTRREKERREKEREREQLTKGSLHTHEGKVYISMKTNKHGCRIHPLIQDGTPSNLLLYTHAHLLQFSSPEY